MSSQPVRVVWIAPDAASASLTATPEEDRRISYLLIRLPNESIVSPSRRREAQREIVTLLRKQLQSTPTAIFFLAHREEFLIGGAALLARLRKEMPGAKFVLWVWPALLESTQLHRVVKRFRLKADDVQSARANWTDTVRAEVS